MTCLSERMTCTSANSLLFGTLEKRRLGEVTNNKFEILKLKSIVSLTGMPINSKRHVLDGVHVASSAKKNKGAIKQMANG